MVFFGVGDLAFKKIFPALRTMVKHGNLNMPVIGVARSVPDLNVLGDAMAGDTTLFAREDYIEEAWRIVDPVLKAGTPLHKYEPKTWEGC